MTVTKVGLTRRFVVRDGMDWAEFFVHEAVSRDDGHGGQVYGATFCCVGSYGVYGNHWSHMGKPFAAFAAGVGRDYLLSKIARQVPSNEKLLKTLRRDVLNRRRERQMDSSKARGAWDELERLESEYMGPALAVMAYESDALSHVGIEWSDVDGQEWDPQAAMFVDRIWPKFVAAMKEGGGA